MSVSSFLLYTLIILLTYILYSIHKWFTYWESRGIPCDKPHPLMGNATGALYKVSFGEILLNYYNKFKGSGPFVGFYWFRRPTAFILDPTLIKNILIKDFKIFTDRGFFSNEVDDPLSGQIFLLDGQKWKNMRNKLSPTFTSGKMKFMFPIVLDVCKNFMSVFREVVEKSEVIEVRELLARFTTDVIGSCAFGIDCNSLKDPEAEFRLMGKKALVEVRQGRIGAMLRHTYPNLARKLHCKQTPEHIEEFFLRVVRETVDYREKNKIHRNDFMDMLIELKNNKLMKSEDGEELKNLTFEEIAAQAFVFFNAGFETSSTTMGFALYELARNQDVQDKLRNEIITVLEKHNQEFTYEAISDMHYLEQVILETLRLYTVLPVLNRYALEDYVVPGHHKYVIEKGTSILIPAWGIHLDPDYFPNPNVFNPDNFSPERVQERDQCLFLAFGEGPRNCVGLRFGKMQARIGLAVLLKNFKFSVCPETQNPITFDPKSFLLSSVGGICLKVVKV